MQRMSGNRNDAGFGRRSIDIGPELQPTYEGSERRAEVLRRAGARARSLLTGKIIFGDGRISFDCVIRNLSAKGARVRISRAVDLSGANGLLFIKEGLLFDATIAWRRGDQIGLAFSGQHDLRGDVDPAHRVVRALWAALAPL